MEQGLAAESDASPESIAAYYDEWAGSDRYEDDVLGWGYEAPVKIAAMVAEHCEHAPGPVLDAGCGVGLVGSELHKLGVGPVFGGDFSAESVKAASARGVYADVGELDLNAVPFELPDDRFTAIVSVGVFSYVKDTAATLAELVRITQPGGIVIFTQRTDLWDVRDCDAILAELAASGRCTVHTSEPLPYLPGHPEFAADINIIYTTLTKTAS